MSNEERRGGIGFGNQRRVDAGARPVEDDDDGSESTRAMDIRDLAPQPTEFARQPPPARPQPMRPAPQPARPQPMRAPPPDDDPDEEAATRMLDAMDDGLAAVPQTPVAVSSQKLEMKVVSGPDRGKNHPLVQGEMTVGRGLDCQIVLADPAVSRRHFVIRRSGDQAVVEDLGGPNGTKINGEKRARHVLAAGDHVEVGTSVLEFQVDGAGRRRAEPRGAADERAPRQEGKPRSQQAGASKRKKIAIAVGLLLLLVVAGVGALLVVGKKGGTGAPAAAAEGDNELDSLLKQAEEQLSAKDYKAAKDTLKKARDLDKSNGEVSRLLRVAHKQQTAQEKLQEAEAALKDGRLTEAEDALKEVGSDSDFASEAKALKAQIDAAKAKGPTEEPAAAEGAAAGAEADAGATAAADAAATAAAAADVAQAVDTADAAKKVDLQAGLSAYGARQWAAARQAFEAVANSAASKDDKKKAKAYAASVAAVEAAAGKASAASGRAAGDAWAAAYQADREINGAHGKYFTDQAVKAYAVAAKAARAAGNCAEAVSLVNELANFDDKHPDVKAVVDGCKGDAKKLLEQADAAMAAGQASKAKELATKANKLLMPDDPLAQKAQDILKKASAAGRAE